MDVIAQEWCPYPKSNAWDQSKSRKFVVQLDGLNELFSNAPATDRNVLADIHLNKNSVIFRTLCAQPLFRCGRSVSKMKVFLYASPPITQERFYTNDRILLANPVADS